MCQIDLALSGYCMFLMTVTMRLKCVCFFNNTKLVVSVIRMLCAFCEIKKAFKYRLEKCYLPKCQA